jgi:hypothetical protein
MAKLSSVRRKLKLLKDNKQIKGVWASSHQSLFEEIIYNAYMVSYNLFFYNDINIARPTPILFYENTNIEQLSYDMSKIYGELDKVLHLHRNLFV